VNGERPIERLVNHRYGFTGATSTESGPVTFTLRLSCVTASPAVAAKRAVQVANLIEDALNCKLLELEVEP
jgi:hypothetical protein